MSAGNDIHNDCMRDAVLVSIINCSTSLFAGIVIFSILGYRAHVEYDTCLTDWKLKANTTCHMPDPKTGILRVATLDDYLDQTAQGPGLAFVAFTEAISTMPVPWLWSILFFFMLLTLGFGSMMGTFVTVRNTVVDLDVIPLRPEFTCGILCIISYLFGLLFCQRSGEYWLQMFDSHVGNIPLLVIGFFEITIVCYVYGIKRFSNDIKFMLGKEPNWYWKAMWLFITPGLIAWITLHFLYITLVNGIEYNAWDHEKVEIIPKNYPLWGEALSVTLMLLSIVFIPVIALMVKTGVFKLQSLSNLDSLDQTVTNNNTDSPKVVKQITKSSSTQALKQYEVEPDRVDRL